MIRAIETFVGCILLVLIVACIPRVLEGAQTAQNPKQLDSVPACRPNTRPQMFCDRVTLDGKHECAICLVMSCTTSTGIYCAASCDDKACRAR